ncbi:phage tail protein, partial [Serratia liquefaciens]
MTFKMSEEAQTLNIYNLRADTQEFIGAGDMYIPPHTGLPANCTDLSPPVIPAGQVAVFDEKTSTWQLREDHRGKTVYDGDTGRAMYISDIGTLPVGAVSMAPTGPHDKWNGTAWVKD